MMLKVLSHKQTGSFSLAKFFLLAGWVCLSLGGCQSLGKKQPTAPPEPGEIAVNESGQPIYVVTVDYSSFFRLGPQQANGADQSLPKGTRLGLAKKSFGYSQVQLEGGLYGYVANEDIAPAPPDVIVPEARNSAIVEKYSVENSRSSAATSSSNAEALPELPEPPLDPEPLPIEKPAFRY